MAIAGMVDLEFSLLELLVVMALGGLPEQLSAADYDLDLCAEDYQGKLVNNVDLDSVNS